MLLYSFSYAKNAIGIQSGIKIDSSFDYNTGINFRSDFSPWGIAASYNIKQKSVDLVFDNWWIYKKINSNINWFTLWGISFGAKTENKLLFETGSRLGIGMNFFCFNNRFFELYFYSAWNPSVGINYNKEDSKTSFCFTPNCFPSNIGFRIWI